MKYLLCILGIAVVSLEIAYATQEQLAQSISDARSETAQTAEQLKVTLDSLNTLTRLKAGDLRPAYTNFTAQIDKTEAAANSTRTRLDWMAGDGQKYFQTWQQSVSEISNPSLRKSAQRRLDSVKASFAKVEAALNKAKEKFVPFLSNLTDVKKALASDLTQGGISAIKSTVESANWDFKFVNSAVGSALKETEKMEKMLSPEVK